MPSTDHTNEQSEVSQRLAQVLSPEAMDALIADAEATDTPIDGADGLLNQITKTVLERSLDTEMTDNLGYDKGASGNSRKGSSGKLYPPHPVRSRSRSPEI